MPTTGAKPGYKSADGAFTRRTLMSIIQAKWPHLSRRQTSDLIASIIDEIVMGLVREGHVQLQGFGAFKVREKKPRPGRNPRTGAPAEVCSRKSVVFHASPVLKSKVQNKDADADSGALT